MDSKEYTAAEQTSLDSTASNASPGSDYLTNLPTELFSTVCELVHRSQEGPYLGMISRRFLPFARRLVFDTVECRSIARIRCLHRALETCPELRSAVRKLVFGRSYSRADDFGEEVPPIPILLACLDNVRVLRIYSGARTAVSCVLQRHATSVLPLLQRIELHGCLDEEQRVHLVDTLGALQQYPHLHEVRLFNSVGPYRVPSAETAPLPLKWLISLSVDGPLVYEPPLLQLLNACVSLRSLSLRNLINGDFLNTVHSSLPRPSNLQRLTLHSNDSFLDYSETLSQLSGVTRLTIGGRLPFKPILGFARRSYKRLTCQTESATADELVTLLDHGRSTLGRLVLDISLLPSRQLRLVDGEGVTSGASKEGNKEVAKGNTDASVTDRASAGLSAVGDKMQEERHSGAAAGYRESAKN